MGPLHPVDARRHRHHRVRAQARASVKVLDRDYLDLTEPINRGILAFLSALAEDERHRILKRANDGRIAATAKGTRFGRKAAEASSAWPPARAARPSPGLSTCTTAPSPGWQGRPHVCAI
jgi:hypothetical protein